MEYKDCLLHDIKSKGKGERVRTYGRISRIGKRTDFWLIKLRTGSCLQDVQIILEKTKIKHPPTLYSTMQVDGVVQTSPDGKTLEIYIEKIQFYGLFDPKDVEVEYNMAPQLLRQKTSQRLLTKIYQATLWIYRFMERSIHKVSEEHALVRVRSPFITFSDCEGGGETFEVKSSIEGFFRQPAYLTVSGQVDEETMTSRFLTPTYIYGPSFRSDPSVTRWHACEFYHYEPEIPFITLDGLMELEESILKTLFREILSDKEAISWLEHLKSDVDAIKKYSQVEFARVSYTEAIKILMKVEDKDFEVKPVWGIDLGKEHERYLCEEYFKRPTFVHGYPSEFKSFYMLQCEPFVDTEISEEPLQICESVDLLVPGIGELCGGSTREYRYDVLLETMKKKGLDPKEYEEYMTLRKQGTFPHGGFGMGFDRLVMMITGAESIRDVSPFPRYYKC